MIHYYSHVSDIECENKLIILIVFINNYTATIAKANRQSILKLIVLIVVCKIMIYDNDYEYRIQIWLSQAMMYNKYVYPTLGPPVVVKQLK